MDKRIKQFFKSRTLKSFSWGWSHSLLILEATEGDEAILAFLISGTVKFTVALDAMTTGLGAESTNNCYYSHVHPRFQYWARGGRQGLSTTPKLLQQETREWPISGIYSIFQKRFDFLVYKCWELEKEILQNPTHWWDAVRFSQELTAIARNWAAWHSRS